MHWYVLRVAANKEMQVKEALERKTAQEGLTDVIGRIEVPTAMGISPRELAFMPRQLAEERCNLQHWTLFPRGGHFAPAENPQGIADDMRAFFRRWH